MNERDRHNDQILIKMSIDNKVIAIRHSNKLPIWNLEIQINVFFKNKHFYSVKSLI